LLLNAEFSDEADIDQERQLLTERLRQVQDTAVTLGFDPAKLLGRKPQTCKSACLTLRRVGITAGSA
jgi:hypothetical protein